jgi:hemoglobin
MDIPVVSARTNPHFERLGGHEAAVRLVDAFYAAMDRRADARVIRAMHAMDLTHTKAVLVDYLTEWMGGPRRYSATRGSPMLKRRHHPFDIGDAARDAWMACMREALATTCPDIQLRGQLDAAFLKIADHIRNTEPHQHQPREPL